MGELGDGSDQFGGRRHGAGRAGGDHRSSRVSGQPRRFGLDQRVAAFGGLDGAMLGEDLRPRLARDLQEFERELPIAVERLGRQPVELLPRHAARRHIIHEPREIVGERERGGGIGGDERRLAALLRRQTLRPFEHELRQQQAPFEPAECRRQLERVAGQGPGCRLRKYDLILVDVAEGDDARQDRRVSLGHVEEDVAREIFLNMTKADAAILPRIVPLGDIDEDEIVFAQAATGALARDALELPPALGGLERRLLLTKLVLKWAQRLAPEQRGEAPLVATNPASALALADDLARLMDDMTTRGVAWEQLDGLAPETLDRYWQLTLEFLQIAREAWPQILAEHGAIEPAERRDALIKAEAARLSAHTGGPVIAAGSTGSMPATAELIATIAKLAHGAVVLPGLDLELDAESWDLIGGRRESTEPVSPAVEHPQFAMQAVLRRIGVTREQVVLLGTPAAHARERYVSEALRPAAVTDRWQQLADGDAPWIERALERLAVIEAANAEEEALAIAISLREAVETPHKTAALVTPDRALARRVFAALERWKVAVDDSGGDALADTPAGLL